MEGNAIPYKGLTSAHNGPAVVQGVALCGRARRTGSASGVDCHGVVVVDVDAATLHSVAAEGRRVEVEGAAIHVDGPPLEKGEREERGGSRGGGVS